MAVAFEIDPLNDNWVTGWSVWPEEGGYVYAEKVREHRAAGTLYPIEEILDSRSFNETLEADRGTVNRRVLYDEAGMFVSYLIDTFGINRMKQAICSVTHVDEGDTIVRRFEEVFGVSVRTAEQAWLAYLDSSM